MLTLVLLFLTFSPVGLASPVSAWQDDGKKQVDKDDDDDDDAKLTDQEKQELEKKACCETDVKYDADTDKKSHPTPEASAGKALVYVVRPTMMGNKIQTKLAVDGEWKGVNRGNNYFFFELEPGEHYFCSKAENRSLLKLSVEAGKTYFLQQKIKMGFMKARNQLVQISDEKGKEGLAKCHPSVFKPKQ